MDLQEHVYSVLIVSAAEKFNAALLPMLPASGYDPVTVVSDISAAKRAHIVNVILKFFRVIHMREISYQSAAVADLLRNSNPDYRVAISAEPFLQKFYDLCGRFHSREHQQNVKVLLFRRAVSVYVAVVQR